MASWQKCLWFLVSLVVLGIVSLYLGGGYLQGDLYGSDTPHALEHITYLYRYWPQKALWQPFHGAGLSLRGINYGAFWLAAMTARVLDWTPIQAVHFWQWSAIYLTSLGTMALGWLLLGPLAGLLAGLFFLLSQISWIWGSRIGLFSFQTSFFWVPLFFIFFSRHLQLKKRNFLFKRRLFLILAGAVLALSFWFHLVVGVLIVEAALFFTLFLPSPKTWGRRLLSWLKVSSLGVLLSFSWWLPFIFYNQHILGGKTNYYTPESLPTVPWRIYLGLIGFSNQNHDIWFSFFALPVLVLAAVGTALGLWRRNKLVLIGLFLSLVFFFQATAIQFTPTLVRIFPFFFSLVNTRAILMTIIFLPLVASFGAKTIGELIWGRLQKTKLKHSLAWATTLLVVGALAWRLDRLPSGYIGRYGSSYGPEGVEILSDCSLSPQAVVLNSFKAAVSPSKEGLSLFPFLAKVASLIPSSDNLRGDVTSIRGEYVQAWSLASSLPILHSSDFISVIPIDFWNYQDETFFQAKGSQEEIEQIAAWLGLDYLVLDKNQDPLNKFTRWPVVGDVDGIQVRRSPQPVGLTTHSSRPAILFFGDPQQDAYFKWWQLLINGGLDYKKAFIVNGGRKVEDYSPGELSRFDLLFFWGEEYRDLKKTSELIKSYLEQGGRILIDTGWQYTSPWWEEDGLPEWLPVESTHWRSLENWQLTSDVADLEKMVSSWSPPHWNDQPWGVSVAKKGQLRPRAEALVVDQLTDSVLVARMPVGAGEIIWTGLNLVGMHQMKDEKGAWLAKTWLERRESRGGGESEKGEFPVKVKRLGPERVEIDLEVQSNSTWLYWRESFYPSWKAELNNGTQLNFYQGGPGLMLVRLPPNSSKVILSHKLHWTIIVGGGVATLAALGVLFGLVQGYWLGRKKR